MFPLTNTFLSFILLGYRSDIPSSLWLSASASIWTHGWRSAQSWNHKYSFWNLTGSFSKPATGEVLKPCPPSCLFAAMSGTLPFWSFSSQFFHLATPVCRFIHLLSETTLRIRMVSNITFLLQFVYLISCRKF